MQQKNFDIPVRITSDRETVFTADEFKNYGWNEAFAYNHKRFKK